MGLRRPVIDFVHLRCASVAATGQAAMRPDLDAMAPRMRSRLRRAASRSGVFREYAGRFIDSPDTARRVKRIHQVPLLFQRWWLGLRSVRRMTRAWVVWGVCMVRVYSCFYLSRRVEADGMGLLGMALMMDSFLKPLPHGWARHREIPECKRPRRWTSTRAFGDTPWRLSLSGFVWSQLHIPEKAISGRHLGVSARLPVCAFHTNSRDVAAILQKRPDLSNRPDGVVS